MHSRLIRLTDLPNSRGWPSWMRESVVVPVLIVLVATLVGGLFALFTGHGPASIGCHDKTVVVRELQAQGYGQNYCTSIDGDRIAEWWTKAGSPTVVISQHKAGGPVLLDSVYPAVGERGGAANDWLDLSPGQDWLPASMVIKAARDLFADTPKLRKLPSKVDCTTGTHTVPITREPGDGEWPVHFTYHYAVVKDHQIVRPKSCLT